MQKQEEREERWKSEAQNRLQMLFGLVLFAKRKHKYHVETIDEAHQLQKSRKTSKQAGTKETHAPYLFLKNQPKSFTYKTRKNTFWNTDTFAVNIKMKKIFILISQNKGKKVTFLTAKVSSFLHVLCRCNELTTNNRDR